MFETVSFQHDLWLYGGYEEAREPLRAGINIVGRVQSVQG
jgi:hypothetical protein